MKPRTLLAIGLCAGLGSGFAAGRTWSSADGGKTFEGDFQSYDAATNKVTVTKNGRPMTFSLEIISTEDQAWVKEQPSPLDQPDDGAAPESLAAFNDSDLGKSLRKMKILQGSSFKSYDYESAPKYFILYYSGSW